uniref:Uncharacterized protein n=1 Tax=Anopheles arabiensis TaxID=7173 RepID=A0A182IGA2_ANOAR
EVLCETNSAPAALAVRSHAELGCPSVNKPKPRIISQIGGLTWSYFDTVIDEPNEHSAKVPKCCASRCAIWLDSKLQFSAQSVLPF